MNIIFDEEINIAEDIIDKMMKAAEFCVSQEGLDPSFCEVSFSFVDKEEIRRLNSEYRQKDAVTDVLSFPQYDDLNKLDNEQEICLGDVVICREVARDQAAEYGHSYERELMYLFVHSILHLLGYDHMEEAEKREMREREEIVMNRIGLNRD